MITPLITLFLFSFYQVCSRDELTLRRRSRSQSHGTRGRRGLLSSLKGLDTLTRRGRDKKQPVSQVLAS